MGIVLQMINGRTCPVVLCDVCGSKIEKAEDGCYVWDGREQGEGVVYTPKYAHTGNCFRIAIGPLDNDQAAVACDIPLSWFVAYFLANLGVDPTKPLPEEWTDMAAMF